MLLHCDLRLENIFFKLFQADIARIVAIWLNFHAPDCSLHYNPWNSAILASFNGCYSSFQTLRLPGMMFNDCHNCIGDCLDWQALAQLSKNSTCNCAQNSRMMHKLMQKVMLPHDDEQQVRQTAAQNAKCMSWVNCKPH